MKFNDKVYDVLKWISIIAIPALITFLSTLLPAVAVPADIVQTVIAIVAGVGTFIGALIGISTSEYKKEHD